MEADYSNFMVSFIIIGKNEANNIERCVESIYYLCEDSLKYEYEILFIDSNSTDSTNEVLTKDIFKDVKKFTVKSNRYSAALSRDIGAKLSSGEYLFFLDADMEIEGDSDLNYCIDLFKDNSIGIVSGELNEVWIKEGIVFNNIKQIFNVISEKDTLISPGGYFLTKKSYYNLSGGFRIDIKCNEEVDLFARYLRENKVLIRTNKLICLHKNEKDSLSKSHIARFKSKYYADFWKVLFSSIKNSYVNEYLRFKSQKRMLRSIILTFVMLILTVAAIREWTLIIIPIVYYLLILINNKFNYKLVLANQCNNILIFLSIIFLTDKTNVRYKVEEIVKGEINDN